ncbi:hypothetical protein EVAR_12942_1 [Eumeta japonica]|uniref:Uncharacterized protein n=1 Tax=Eumeta variegata TaxID=151549 RepID=A0A4C1TVW5_EUMVA|nr:hypothetical protein EVAR_12942_1 [Eumeta japonica]
MQFVFTVFRVYHHVQSWLGRHQNPEDWGRKKHASIWMPIQAFKLPAPVWGITGVKIGVIVGGFYHSVAEKYLPTIFFCTLCGLRATIDYYRPCGKYVQNFTSGAGGLMHCPKNGART